MIESLKILDIEFLIRPDHKDGPIISGQSKKLNKSCHVRLSDELLKSEGLEYLLRLCKGIESNMAYHYKHYKHNPLIDSQ